jgi:RNA polymerase sigma-70 factor, ECF subfamily
MYSERVMEEDNNLIHLSINGDENALRELIEKYTPQIYNFARRFSNDDESPDLTQEIFIKVWKNLKKFNQNKSSFKTWLFTIARNTITDFLRKKKSILFSSLDNEESNFSENIEDKAILPDEVLQKLQDVEMLNSLLEKLPEQYQTVLILHYQESMTFEEISKILGKPLNTVKSFHFRALIKLKKMVAPKQ